MPRILIIEDTALIAMMLEDVVRLCGCDVVGPAYSLWHAREAVGRHDYDAVLLDIGLDGARSFEIADVLLERGVPFAFVTAYHDVLEPRHQHVPLVAKPFSTDVLVRTVQALVGSNRGPGVALAVA